MKRGLTYAAAVIAAAAVLFIGSLWIPLEPAVFTKENIHSVRVFDRNDQLLREFLNDEQGRGEWIPLEKIAQPVIGATVAVEDRRFYGHFGVDPIAVVRAFTENVLSSRVRFGASTITQQVIRNVFHHPRTLPFKLLEAWYAMRLERMMDKNEILEQYLNRAPYGNQLFGIQAASKYYFDKPASDLTIAESAFLAALPNSPTLLNPYQHYKRAVARQHLVLERLFTQQKISPEENDRALKQPIPVILPNMKFKAPHAVEMVYSRIKDIPQISSVKTTIDASIQHDVHWIVKDHLEQLKERNVTNASVVILDNRTGEIRTMLGSSDYFNDAVLGKINGTVALRQPGSSVKPFTYGTAMEAGYTPATMLADIPTSIPNDGGDYVPENYDREYHGPVLLRTALACSYNIPAVRVLHSIGVEALYQRLQSAGITSLTESPKHYGFGLTLGNAEVTLLELTNAYRAIANAGELTPMRLLSSAVTINGLSTVTSPLSIETQSARTVFTPEIAYLLTDILSDHSARRPAFGKNFAFSFPCAVKTGTTKDYKDNWTVGYTTEYTVGVWAGNFNASPMRKVSGVSGAGQIFTDIMNMLAVKYGAVGKEFVRPASLIPLRVCARSGKRMNGNCDRGRTEYFVKGMLPEEQCSIHQKFFVPNISGISEAKVFEIFPPEYDEWSRTEQIPLPPENAVADRAAVQKPASKAFTIMYPHDGDIFKLDPVLRKEFQRIRIDAVIPKTFRNVRLKVNASAPRSYTKNDT
jgi:penicillin-binding protein 1C